MKFFSRLSFRCGVTALAAVCLLSISGQAWSGEETKPATTPATTPAAAPAAPEDPHKSADPSGASNGTDLGSDLGNAKGGVIELSPVPELDKDGKPVMDKDGKPKFKKDEKGNAVMGIAFKQTPDEIAGQVIKTRNGLNMLWTCIAGFMVFFMQAGFALVETGFTRAKNAAHCMGMNMMVFCIGFIGYYVCGYAFMFGGMGKIDTLGGTLILDKWLIGSDAGWHILGGKGFLWTGLFDSQVMAHFMFQMVFMDTAATIPTGSMAERIKWGAFVWMSFFLTMITYPVIGCWMWGGGWLSQIGVKWSGLTPDAVSGAVTGAAAWGNGAIDFSGSGVIHMVGGWTALVGAYVLGPRIGKYDKAGNSRPIPGHDIPMAVLGTIILFFGWFGFNPGSTLAATDGILPVAAVNTMIAGAFGGFTSMLYMMYIHPAKKPDPGMCCNGILAGLVAITAPCAYVSPTASVIIGVVAGVLVIVSVGFVENTLKVDDPVGAFSVHGVNGLFGVLCVGLFACGTYGGGTNSVQLHIGDKDYGVLGLFPIGGPDGMPWGQFGQMKSQILFAIVDILFVVGIEFAFFKIYDSVFGLRVKPEDEISGLDIPEMGCPAYPNWPIHEAPGMAYDNLPAGVAAPSAIGSVSSASA